MTTTRTDLVTWLEDVPDDAEIGTDQEEVTLLAISATKVSMFDVAHLPHAREIYAHAIKLCLIERLHRIRAAGGCDTQEGVIIVTLKGYISDDPNLFSTDFNTAFLFKDTEQAEAFITEFGAQLYDPQILNRPQ